VEKRVDEERRGMWGGAEICKGERSEVI